MIGRNPAMSSRVTRLAPSPTGALHLGNVRTFLINWAMARQDGWAIRMRVEDLDGPRVKSGAAAEMLGTLRWLGIDWDGDTITQSDDLAPYRTAMDALARAGLVYPCDLTRGEIEAAASAPHAGDHETRFPPELRPERFPDRFDDESTGWRFVTRPGTVTIDDRIAGRVRIDPSATVGDFVVWTKRGQPSYQLAVVVDDARQGVTDVVRGADLLDSAARQCRLIEALGLSPVPAYAHLPLVVGPDGRRLAKRHGDTRVSRYGELGVPPERVIGVIAHWSGAAAERTVMSREAFLDRFRLDTLPRHPVVFTPEDERWLLDAAR